MAGIAWWTCRGRTWQTQQGIYGGRDGAVILKAAGRLQHAFQNKHAHIMLYTLHSLSDTQPVSVSLLYLSLCFLFVSVPPFWAAAQTGD